MRRTVTAMSSISGLALVLLASGAASAQCVGDCSGDGQVTVDEIVTGIGIALGNATVDGCPAFDSNSDDQVTVDEIVTSVTNALNGCPGGCGDCDDGDACTTDVCVEDQCEHEPVMCQDDGEECTAELCDMTTGCTSVAVEDGTSCDAGAGSCEGGACVPFECVESSDCDDANECTTDTCAENACVLTNVADGTSCNGGVGSCEGGVCAVEATIQYQQDFEALDMESETALSGEGWVVFGNVFDGTGRYLYGYGAFPAPNGGAAFSAIVEGQGGAEQGVQQLSIYNDYNNQDHAKGYRIESNVFRERRITVADVGTTLTFAFDAKRGNVNDPTDPLCPCTSTAIAFIKTLNPAAGFATTNFVQVDTATIPEFWNRYSISLPIDAGLANQLLQVGFSTTATLFQPSNVFYDNVEVSAVPTAP